MRWLVAALLLVAMPAASATRVVSLNLCTDQMVVLLAPKAITALSVLAADPALSAVAAEAARFPTVRASAEAVLALRPELVLATRYGAQTTLAQLRARGVAVYTMDLAEDFPAIRRVTRDLAAVLGVPERGEALLADMDAILTTAGPTAPARTAIAWEPRGFTAGPDSLMGAIMSAAGLINRANGRVLGTEALLHDPPDLLIVPERPAFPSLATDMLTGAALSRTPQRAVPPALTLCATPLSARAVALLRP